MEETAIEKSPEQLRKEIDLLKGKLERYEQNGAAKLYYSLNRKMNEMADVMNNNSLQTLDFENPKDKTFERLQKIWTDASGIATAVKALGEIAGVTGDEKSDIEKKPFIDRLAENRL